MIVGKPWNSTVKECIEILDDITVGLDKEKSLLDDVFRRWESSKKGDSCIVTGARGSGRTSTVRKIASNYCPVEAIRVIYICQIGTDTTAQQDLNIDDNGQRTSRVIILEDADELVNRNRQTLLYSILDATRREPWLVILMTNKQDFVQLLEKRVRSRLSTNKIHFEPAITYSTYYDAFVEFLQAEKHSKEWREFATSFRRFAAVRKELEFMHKMDNSYCGLKRCVVIFLNFLLGLKEEGESRVKAAADLWSECIQIMWPNYEQDHLHNIINSISLRTFCVFLCAYRRLKHQPVKTSVVYHKLRQDYMKLVITVDRRMQLSHDCLVAKELDQLCELGILDCDKRDAHNSQYKRVSLHAEAETYQKAVESRTIPASITEWSKMIPDT